MTAFLAIGAVGVLLLLVSVVLGDHVQGVFEVLDAGDWLTGASFAAFLGGLGFGGALALDRTDNTPLAIAVGIGVGVLLGVIATWATFGMRKLGDGSAPTQHTLIGVTGTVVTDIPLDGFGEVRVLNAGHLTKVAARADRPIPAGTEVWITETLSATSVRVRPTRDAG